MLDSNMWYFFKIVSGVSSHYVCNCWVVCPISQVVKMKYIQNRDIQVWRWSGKLRILSHGEFLVFNLQFILIQYRRFQLSLIFCIFVVSTWVLLAEAYLEPSRTSTVELFRWKYLTGKGILAWNGRSTNEYTPLS